MKICVKLARTHDDGEDEDEDEDGDEYKRDKGGEDEEDGRHS